MGHCVLKTSLLIMLIAALMFGFFHHLVPPEKYNFERLHIFLFNLCSGGTLLLYYTEKTLTLSLRGLTFLIFSIIFACCAFMHWYIPAMIIPLVLGGIVEQVRIKAFGGLIPGKLFSRQEGVASKFHQAALLCLSLALFISSVVICNSEYTHWLHSEKLKLDTFFLGYSFPVSLISMSVIFSLMKRNTPGLTALLKETSFWVINLGVIIFFLFILGGLFLPQVGIAVILFIAVVLVLFLYWRQGIRLQQKAFLTSGILFLLVTSITGILYILLSFSSYYLPQYSQPLLRLHAFTALYGWNLSGLAVISRIGDFPIQLHSRKVILLHWVTVLLLCPLGYFMPVFAILAVMCYSILIALLLFQSSHKKSTLTKRA